MTAAPFGVGQIQNGSTDTLSTSLVCPLPAGTAAGDFLLATVITDAAAINAVSGWTSAWYNVTLSNPRVRVFYKVATAADVTAGSATFTISSAVQAEVVIEGFHNVDTTAPIDFVQSAESATAALSIDVPAATIGVSDTILVGGAAANSGNSVVTFGLPTTPGAWTSPWNPANGTGGASAKSKAAVRGEYLTGLAAGASSGIQHWTLSASRAPLAWTIGLRSVNTAPALLARVVGVAGKVKVQTARTNSVRLAIGTDQAVSQNVVYTSAATPDADGWATLTLPALTAGGTYYYRVLMTGSDSVEHTDNETTVGRIRVAPTVATSFAFNAASCCDAADSPAMDKIHGRQDDLFLHLGDMWYADGSGQDLANYQGQMGDKLRAPFHSDVFATTPSAFVPSDHDFGMLNGAVGSNQPTAVTNYNQVYRQMLPNTPVPATTGVYHTFTWGRVRFIMLDQRTFKSLASATDDASKTMLGATQKQWVKDTITAATEELIILVGDCPWTGPVGDPGQEHWGVYNTERQELASFMTSSGKKFAYIAGDMHAVAADDGANSAGAIPTFQCAPIQKTASIKGGPYSVGPYPASGTALIRQYGRFQVTDNGGAITLDWTGWDHLDNQLLTMTVTFGDTITGTVVLDGVTKPVTGEWVVIAGGARPVKMTWTVEGGQPV